MQVSGGGPSAFAPVQYHRGGAGGGASAGEDGGDAAAARALYAGALHDSDAARSHMHLYQTAPRL